MPLVLGYNYKRKCRKGKSQNIYVRHLKGTKEKYDLVATLFVVVLKDTEIYDYKR